MLDVSIHYFPYEMDGIPEPRIIASVKGEPVGTIALCNLTKKASSFYQLFVVPSLRNNGIGSSLVQAAEKESRRLGLKAISAVIMSDELMTFYAKLGFEPVHHQGNQTLISKRL